MRVAVYTVCKDEEHNVEEWYQSAANADVICVADTGSKDKTVPLFQAKGNLVKFSQISIDPWRFDDARNAALALVPADRKSTRLNSSHSELSRMPSSA